MRRWEYATRERCCGNCGAVIPKGALLLEIHLTQVRYALVRCPAHADLPLPDTVPSIAEPHSAPIDAVGARELAMTRIVPEWSWLLKKRDEQHPEHFPDLVPIADAWSPFRDGD